MNPIFKHGPSPQYRVILMLICSTLLIFFDHKMTSFERVRGYLQSLVSPLQYLATAPKQLLDWSVDNMVTKKQLVDDNKTLKMNELVYKERAIQLRIVQQENDRLRALLHSPVRVAVKTMLAEILSVDGDPYSQQVVINRGANDDVHEGQAIVDDQGVVGQILHAGTITSRVLLITDVSHAVPVRIERNGTRLVASGTGNINRMSINHVSNSTDIKPGDLLVTSGLGGKYPEGYPVARVTIVKKDESRPFAYVQSEPIAQINRLRYLLLLWPQDNNILSSAMSFDARKEK
jgi:rod shape-determining protein MreC